MMIRQVLNHYRKLRENDAFGLLLQPRVLANYRLYQQEVAARPLIMTSQPPAMEIELTNRCNLACVQCLRSRGLRPYALGDMAFGHYQTILAQFPYVTNMNLNGFGEALMHEQFFDIVAYTRRVRPWCKIGIYSNGMLIDDDRAYKLTRSGVTEVNVSIDAARPDTYRRVRRGGRLDVVHDNIRRLMRIRRTAGARFPMVGVNFVMLNENDGELVPFVEQAADLGVDFINCISYAAYDWGFQNTRTPENYRQELAAAARRIVDLGIRCKSFPSDDLSWTDKNRHFDCSFFWGGSLRITYAGEITLGCCSPFKETFSYGNVLERPFSEIWNDGQFQRNRALTLERTPPCATCASCDAFGKSFFDEHDGIWRLRPVN